MNNKLRGKAGERGLMPPSGMTQPSTFMQHPVTISERGIKAGWVGTDATISDDTASHPSCNTPCRFVDGGKGKMRRPDATISDDTASPHLDLSRRMFPFFLFHVLCFDNVECLQLINVRSM